MHKTLKWCLAFGAVSLLAAAMVTGCQRVGETGDGKVKLSFQIWDTAQRKLKNVREGVNTYWLAKPLRTEFNHKHSLYLEGGNEEFRYGIDLGCNKENGVMKGSYRDRIDAGFSIYYTTSKVQVSNYISYGVTKEKESPYGEFSQYTKMLHYERSKDDDGNMFSI